jgi:hypothetical protein
MEEVIGQTGEDPKRKDEIEEIVPHKQRRVSHEVVLCNVLASPDRRDRQNFGGTACPV